MVDLSTLRAGDLKALGPDAIAEVASRMLAQLASQTRQIDQQQSLIDRRDAEIKFKDAKLERLTFELARFKAWRFEGSTAEDDADLQAQLNALQGDTDTHNRRPRPASRVGRSCPNTCGASSTATSPQTPPASRRVSS